jgi:periplasmic protein CpxP/Spy
MRNIVSTFALGALLLTGFSSTTLLAQDQATGTQTQAAHVPNPQRQAKRMAKKLGLTSDQVAKIEPILADRAQQVQSVRADTTLAAQDRAAKLKGIRQDSESKIEAVLTDAQRQTYEQMKQERKARHQQRAAASANS